jgi:L-asparaginase
MKRQGTTGSKPVRKKRVVAPLVTMSVAAAVSQSNLALAAAGTVTPTSATSAVAGTTGAAAVDRPRVLILATGGTIAGKTDPRAENAYDAGSVSAQQLIQSVPDIDKLADLRAEQIASIGSQDMNDQVWFRLARRIQQISDRNEADAIVITHGTDTLEETAFFLDNVLHTDKPVVLVGSMRPSTAIGAGGPADLYEAVEVAASRDARGRGVMAARDGIVVVRSTRVGPDPSTGTSRSTTTRRASSCRST